VPHMSSARNMLTALTCHSSHMGDPLPPLELALPTPSCRMHSALLRDPCQLYPDLNSPVYCRAPGFPLFFQNDTGPRLS